MQAGKLFLMTKRILIDLSVTSILTSRFLLKLFKTLKRESYAEKSIHRK